jgi:hypothetical protein
MTFFAVLHNRIFSLIVLSSFICVYSSEVHAQILPGIGIDVLPNDEDPICSIPTVSSNPNGGGPIVGELVQDFNLFEVNGTPHRLSDELSEGVPVLLISGSLTCPVFRNRVPMINAMASAYQNVLKIFIVYTVEAHPTDPSPYSGEVWITLENENNNILFPQPTTYGERKSLIDTLTNLYEINVPILLDGPCNNWWLNYGTGANNAFLITTSGYVFSKHDWFNQLQLNMACDADLLLSYFSGLCQNYNSNGTFSFELTVDSLASGMTNDVLAVEATIYNNSLTDFVVIDILKIESDLPENWETALCADICYTPDADSVRIAVPPGGQQNFIFYFYTSEQLGTGQTLVLFRNVYVSNRHYQEFYGTANSSASINTIEETAMTVYPNPATNSCSILNLDEFGSDLSYTIANATGQVVAQGSVNGDIDVSHLSIGNYTLMILGEHQYAVEALIIE